MSLSSKMTSSISSSSSRGNSSVCRRIGSTTTRSSNVKGVRAFATVLQWEPRSEHSVVLSQFLEPLELFSYVIAHSNVASTSGGSNPNSKVEELLENLELNSLIGTKGKFQTLDYLSAVTLLTKASLRRKLDMTSPGFKRFNDVVLKRGVFDKNVVLFIHRYAVLGYAPMVTSLLERKRSRILGMSSKEIAIITWGMGRCSIYDDGLWDLIGTRVIDLCCDYKSPNSSINSSPNIKSVDNNTTTKKNSDATYNNSDNTTTRKNNRVHITTTRKNNSVDKTTGKNRGVEIKGSIESVLQGNYSISSSNNTDAPSLTDLAMISWAVSRIERVSDTEFLDVMRRRVGEIIMGDHTGSKSMSDEENDMLDGCLGMKDEVEGHGGFNSSLKAIQQKIPVHGIVVLLRSFLQLELIGMENSLKTRHGFENFENQSLQSSSMDLDYPKDNAIGLKPNSLKPGFLPFLISHILLLLTDAKVYFSAQAVCSLYSVAADLMRLNLSRIKLEKKQRVLTSVRSISEGSDERQVQIASSTPLHGNSIAKKNIGPCRTKNIENDEGSNNPTNPFPSLASNSRNQLKSSIAGLVDAAFTESKRSKIDTSSSFSSGTSSSSTKIPSSNTSSFDTEIKSEELDDSLFIPSHTIFSLLKNLNERSRVLRLDIAFNQTHVVKMLESLLLFRKYDAALEKSTFLTTFDPRLLYQLIMYVDKFGLSLRKESLFLIAKYFSTLEINDEQAWKRLSVRFQQIGSELNATELRLLSRYFEKARHCNQRIEGLLQCYIGVRDDRESYGPS